MKEITWYGRGGQGAFTGSRILGAAAMFEGFRALAFPSFGPERRGAPIRAFTKIAVNEIADRSVIKKSDYIIVLDDTLYNFELLDKLKENGRLLINTKIDSIAFGDKRVVSFDVSGEAVKILKKPIVNVGILGILLNLDKDITKENVEKAIREYMPAKTVEKNMILLEKIKEYGMNVEILKDEKIKELSATVEK